MDKQTSIFLLVLIIQVASIVSIHLGPKFDTSQWLCSSTLDVSQLGVQYFTLNLQSSSTNSEPNVEHQFLLLDLSLNGGDWSYQHCIYQVDLSPQSSRVVKNWACGYETILQMCKTLLDIGNIESVFNVTTEIVDYLKAKKESHMPMLRAMLNCNVGASERHEILNLREALRQNVSKHDTLDGVAGPSNVSMNVTGNATTIEPVAQADTLATTELIDDFTTLKEEDENTTLVRAKRQDNSSLPFAVLSNDTDRSTQFLSNQTIQFSNIGKPLGIVVLIVVAITVILIIYVYWFDNAPYIGPKRTSKDTDPSNVSRIPVSSGKHPNPLPPNVSQGKDGKV